MKLSAVYILLIIVVSLIPVSYLFRYISNKVRPRESAARLVLLLLIGCALIVIYTFLLVLLITKLFPRP